MGEGSCRQIGFTAAVTDSNGDPEALQNVVSNWIVDSSPETTWSGSLIWAAFSLHVCEASAHLWGYYIFQSLYVLQEQKLKFQFIINLKRPKSNATKRYVRYVLTASSASLLKVRFADECINLMSHFVQIEKKTIARKIFTRQVRAKEEEVCSILCERKRNGT